MRYCAVGQLVHVAEPPHAPAPPLHWALEQFPGSQFAEVHPAVGQLTLHGAAPAAPLVAAQVPVQTVVLAVVALVV